MNEKLIFCHDGSLAAMIAVKNKSKRWDLLGISEVMGMGNAEYKKKLFDFDFTEVEPMNSHEGISYVCLKKDDKWGLLEVKSSETANAEWKLIADFVYVEMEVMLSEVKIEKQQ